MGTWSISPSSDKASIDQNGKATFGRHETEDVEYTITYTPSEGEDCGTTPLTITYTVKKCGENPPEPVGDFVPTMDNMGQICNCSKCVKSGLETLAPPSDEPCDYHPTGSDCQEGCIHWWTGPIDGHEDAGIPAAGGEIDGDSIMYEGSIGNGTNGQFVTEYTDGDLHLKSNDDWLAFCVSVSPHTLGDATSPGWVTYSAATNTTGAARHGTVAVTTTGGTCNYHWCLPNTSCWEIRQHYSTDYTEYMKSNHVHFYQLG